MALTSRIITRSTPLLASLMLAGLVGSAWAFIELAPDREVETSIDDLPRAHVTVVEIDRSDHRAERPKLRGPFSPDHPPADPGLCAWTADQIFNHYDRLRVGDDVEVHSRGVNGLVEAYLDLRCPAAVHQGDWHVTAQILGVGIVYELLRERAEQSAFSGVPVDLDIDPRAVHVLPLATGTFEVLAPTRMCREASRGHVELHVRCLSAFGR